MKLVILAAGKGTRMGKIGENIPKPLLKYEGRSLIQHKLEQIPKEIHEIIVVIGYLGDQIVDTFGNSYKGIPVTYVWQEKLLGTGDSLWAAKESLKNTPFIVLMGDDLYSKEDLSQMIRTHRENSESWVALVQYIDRPMTAGKCILDKQGILLDIVEDPKAEIPNNIMYTGACLLTPEIFDLPLVKLENKEEYGLPQTFIQKEKTKTIYSTKATYWKRITEPRDLE